MVSGPIPASSRRHHGQSQSRAGLAGEPGCGTAYSVTTQAALLQASFNTPCPCSNQRVDSLLQTRMSVVLIPQNKQAQS